MTISCAPSVKAEPCVRLTNWMLLEAYEQRFFVGRCEQTGQGRISSAIRSFDAHRCSGITLSGRTYAFVGNPGIDSNIRALLEHWIGSNDMSKWRDASAEVVIMNASSALSDKLAQARRRQAGPLSLIGGGAAND